jgi:hypothetical protein
LGGKKVGITTFSGKMISRSSTKKSNGSGYEGNVNKVGNRKRLRRLKEKFNRRNYKIK